MSGHIVALQGVPGVGPALILACKVCGKQEDIHQATILAGRQRQVEEAFHQAHAHGAVPTEPLDAHAFARSTPPYSFGLDAARASEALRRLAGDIDGERVLLQQASVTTQAKTDEWTTTILTVAYVQKRPNPKE